MQVSHSHHLRLWLSVAELMFIHPIISPLFLLLAPLFSVLSYELNPPPVFTIKFVKYTVDLFYCCKQILAIYLAIASPLCPGG